MTLDMAKGPGEVEAEVLMTRLVHKGSFLLVEGDDDSRFWNARVNPDACEVVIGQGKPNVVGAIGKLDARHFRGAMGIVDDDFDSLMGRKHASSNLVATETHDLECLILRSYPYLGGDSVCFFLTTAIPPLQCLNRLSKAGVRDLVCAYAPYITQG